MSGPHNARPEPDLHQGSEQVHIQTTPAVQQYHPATSHKPPLSPAPGQLGPVKLRETDTAASQQAGTVGPQLSASTGTKGTVALQTHSPNAQTVSSSPSKTEPQSILSDLEGAIQIQIEQPTSFGSWSSSWNQVRNSAPSSATRAVPQALNSPSVLIYPESEHGLAFLRKHAKRVNALRESLLEQSTDTATAKSERDALKYAQSRGSDNTQGMSHANIESVNQAQVWRTAAVIVRENLLKVDKRSRQTVPRNTVRPYLAFPSVVRAQCAIVWRDIYDVKSAATDQLSIRTRIEVAVASRTAYNWLNNRHTSIIANDVDGYIQAVIQVIRTGMPAQHKSCAISIMSICFGLPDATIEPNVEVVKQLTDLIIYDHLEARENPVRHSRRPRPLLDHHNQMAITHVRGQWGGDLSIANETRRRSEVLNFVAHGSIVLVRDEIRTCPCQAEDIITSMVRTTVEARDFVTCDDVLKEPGLIRYRRGQIILSAYILVMLVSACAVITLSVRATSEGFEKVSGVLSGWTWSVALVSALHVFLIKNLLPGTTLRHLGQGKRQARDLCDMKLEKGALILLAQDARTNHLLAQGNACAYANRPSGKVQVSDMPSGLDAWQLGLVVTDKFAIKLQQNTPLIRKTVENLDGSIHVDWDEPVEDGIVGRLLRNEVKVGNGYRNTVKKGVEGRDMWKHVGDELC